MSLSKSDSIVQWRTMSGVSSTNRWRFGFLLQDPRITKPLCLRVGKGDGDRERTVFSKKFKVEASWMVDEEYKIVVADAWQNSGLGG
jgi:hypothetical protein